MGALSGKEKLILDLLQIYPTVKDVSFHLRNDEKYFQERLRYPKRSKNPNADAFSPTAIYQILYRIRQRQKQARILINTLLPYRNKNAYLSRLLTPKEKMKIDSNEDGFNVEMPQDKVLMEEHPYQDKKKEEEKLG